MDKILRESRKGLYEKQVKVLGMGYGAFVSPDFVCISCGKDLFDDERTYEVAKDGGLITGCPFCYKSFCE